MAQLNLTLSKMRYLKIIVEGHLETARRESDGSPESKTVIQYKQSILDGIESAIIHAEVDSTK